MGTNPTFHLNGHEDTLLDSPSTFEGQAFHPALPKGRGPGTLHAEPGSLRFTPDDSSVPPVALPFDGIALRLGGASDRVLFFTHPEHPDVTLYTSDHRILEHSAMSSQASVVAQVGAVKRRKNVLRFSFAAVLGTLVLAVLGLILAWGPIIGWVTDQVPPELEVKLGDVVFGQVQTQTALIRDETLEAELDRLAAPLLDALPETGYAFDLHLADDPSLNAFAIPGGHVVIHSGLILAAETPEEVLGVLGHELAHVTERHSLRQIVGSAGLFVVVQTLLGDVTGLAAVLADGGTQLLTLGFSRDHELEADAVGWRTLLDADIDPEGMITFFETLEAEQQEMLGEDVAALESTLAFLSTHPATSERIEMLREMWERLDSKAFPEINFDFYAFQEQVRQVITHDTSPETAPDAPPETL